jgi:hypothetical protein
MNQPIQQGSIEMTDTRENASQVGRQDGEEQRRKEWKKPEVTMLGNDRSDGKAGGAMETFYNTFGPS